jgi:hypothetical protein
MVKRLMARPLRFCNRLLRCELTAAAAAAVLTLHYFHIIVHTRGNVFTAAEQRKRVMMKVVQHTSVCEHLLAVCARLCCIRLR